MVQDINSGRRDRGNHEYPKGLTLHCGVCKKSRDKTQVRGRARIIDDKRHTHDDLNDLLFDLSLENGKIVETEDGTAFQGKHAYLSNLADCQLVEGEEDFQSAEQYILINKAQLAKDNRA